MLQSNEKAKPILFSTPMVKDIIAGKKRQTRRIMKPQPLSIDEERKVIIPYNGSAKWLCETRKKPYEVGQIMWVRETWLEDIEADRQPMYFYKASAQNPDIWNWKPSIHMPRSAARIFLKVTDVRTERIQDGGDREFWGEATWHNNPWVWVIEFERIQPNENVISSTLEAGA
jgi:hypothetical protein